MLLFAYAWSVRKSNIKRNPKHTRKQERACILYTMQYNTLPKMLHMCVFYSGSISVSSFQQSRTPNGRDSRSLYHILFNK